MQHSRAPRLIAGTMVLLIAGVVLKAVALRRHPTKAVTLSSSTITAIVTATKPADLPSTRVKAPLGPATRYFDVIRSKHPNMASTQPLTSPLDLPDAAHVVISDPLYLSPRLDLWITRPDAPSVDDALPAINRDQNDQVTPVVRDQVAYVHWQPHEADPWTFEVVCRRGDGEGYDVVTSRGRTRLPWGRNFRWDLAQEWNEDVIVPSDGGISIVHFSPQPGESFHPLVTREVAQTGGLADAQFIFDWEGILAWIPWENGKTGSRGLVRCVKTATLVDNEPVLHPEWTDLTPELGWPEKPMQALPLSDGSVMQLVADNVGTGKLVVQTLEKLTINEDAIGEIVGNLSDEDQEKRDAAFKKLSGYGPGLWPILEKMRPDEPPEGQHRIDQLLGSRAAPTLGGRKLLGDKMQIVARHNDGGATVFLENGVSIPGEDPDSPELRVPAWVDIRPGPSIEVLDEALVGELKPGKSQIWSRSSEWIVNSDPRGPRRFVGNSFVPLLHKDEVDRFREFVGIDRRGRWIFREPADGRLSTTRMASPTTALSSTTRISGMPATLILDPTIPDPTPRLPVWIFAGEEVGWDKDDNPAVRTGDTWAVLKSAEWVALEKKDKVFTKAAQVPSFRAATHPTSVPTTVPSTKPSATRPASRSVAATEPAAAPESWGKPIGIASDGSQYFGGLTDLRRFSPDGASARWTLPGIANGQGEAHLVSIDEKALYLFNLPGRVLRIRPTPEHAQPFEIEATFTKRIPSNANPSRIWLDPNGRIIVASTGQLTILFPKGYIPPLVAKMIPVDQLHLDDQ